MSSSSSWSRAVVIVSTTMRHFDMRFEAREFALLGVFLLGSVAAGADSVAVGTCGEGDDDAGAVVSAAVSALNWRHVYLMLDYRPLPHTSGLLKPLSCLGVAAAVVSGFGDEQMEFLRKTGNNSTVVYLAEASAATCYGDFARLLDLELNPYSVLLYSPEVHTASLEHCFRSYNESKAFFVVDAEGELSLVQTFHNQDILVRNVWKEADDSDGMEENFDLGGATITMNTLSWMPWMRIFDCEEPAGTDCDSEGLLREVLDVLAGMYNFTYVVDREPSGKWGVVPADGVSVFDPNATFFGVMGSSIEGRYDLPISLWDINLGRSNWIDFTMSVVDRPASVFVNARPPLDFTLFFRPFTAASWAGIGVMVVFLSASFLSAGALASRAGLRRDSSVSWRVLAISGWVLFLLLQAFYGGALTMFFSSAPSLPFRNLKEAMALYPDWKMMVTTGEEVLVNIPANNGEEEFIKQKERMLKGEEGLLQQNYPDGIRMLAEPGWFLYASRFAVTSTYASGDFDVSVHEVSREYVLDGTLLVRKHSPLTRMLDDGIQRLRQTGMLHALTTKWTEDLSGHAEPDAQVVKVRQAVVVFMAFAAAAAVCAVVFLAELTAGKLADLCQLRRIESIH